MFLLFLLKKEKETWNYLQKILNDFLIFKIYFQLISDFHFLNIDQVYKLFNIEATLIFRVETCIQFTFKSLEKEKQISLLLRQYHFLIFKIYLWKVTDFLFFLTSLTAQSAGTVKDISHISAEG